MKSSSGMRDINRLFPFEISRFQVRAKKLSRLLAFTSLQLVSLTIVVVLLLTTVSYCPEAAEAGTEKWSFETEGAITSSPAIGSDGTIYFGSHGQNHNLYAINPNGTEKWSFETGDNIHSSPAIGSDGTIYVGSFDHKLYAINSDGTKKWSFETGDYVKSSPAIGPDGTIYVGSNDHKLYAINSDGTEKWSFATGARVTSSPAIGSDGTIYVGSGDHKLYAINSDGTKKWSFATGNSIYSSPAIGSDGTIYVGSRGHKLYAVNPNGTEKWSFGVGWSIESSPAIGSDGTIYVGSHNDKLYAMSGNSGGLADTPWPMFHHDFKHTGRAAADINVRPVAKFTFSPDNPDPEETVTFDASSSTDSDGNITQHKWDWDDDGNYEDSLTSSTIEYSFSTAGDYPVTLKVVDNEGASDTTTQTLTVEDTTSPETTITSGPSGEIDYRDVTFEWTGSDNMTATSDLTYSYKLEGEDDSWSNWTYDTSTSYSDLQNGDYTFEVKARDEAGNVDSNSAIKDFIIHLVEPGAIKWAFNAGAISTSPAIDSKGVIYVGAKVNHHCKLYAINPDGTKKWECEYGGRCVHSSPTIGPDGTIYIGAKDGKLYAISPEGTKKWEYEVGDRIYSTPAIDPDGTIYFGSWSSDNKLYALNPDGTKKWEFIAAGGVNSSPAIAPDGTIYAGSTGGLLYALNPNGTKKWEFNVGSDIYSSPAIGINGAIYVGANNGKLYSINFDGTKKWEVYLGGYIHSSPVISHKGVIYVGAYEKSKFYAINPDGTIKWEFNTAGDIDYSSGAIGADGTIYIGSLDPSLYGGDPNSHEFYAINPDGTKKWSLDAGNITSSPAIGSDGVVYIGTWRETGKLYALYGNSGGLADSSWPMFHQDLQHTGRASDVNFPPEAVFTLSPDSPEPGETITFDASSSSDSDGNIAQYKWDWDDDGTYEDSQVSPTIEHSYSTEGSYPVTLKVIDNGGATDTSTQTVTVEDTIPPDPDPMTWSNEPTAAGISDIDMQATSATDPEGNGVEYYFEETTGNSGGSNSNWQDSNSYTDTGLESGTEYCYRVKARDKSSNQNETDWSTTKCATTDNQLPEAAFTYTPDNPVTDESITFDASNSSDPDGSIDTYKWDWTDDGSYESTTSTATTTHSYEDDGTYTVRLEVVDDDGATDTATNEVHVRKNTQKGKDVEVGFEKSKYFYGKMRGVMLTYEEVTATGSTGVIKQPEPEFGQPQGITFLGGFYKIETTASYQGDILVEIYYDGTDLTSQQENNLKLFKLSSEGEYKDITESVDKQEDVITGRTDSFSHFSLGYGTGTVPSTDIVNHGPNPMPAEGGIFWFDLPQDAESGLLKVYDVDGTPLLTVDINSTQKRYPAIGRWNLRADGGDKLGNGIYIYRLKVDKDDGSTIWSTVHKLVIDRRK